MITTIFPAFFFVVVMWDNYLILNLRFNLLGLRLRVWKMDNWEFGPYFVLLLELESIYWMQIVKTNWALLTRQTDPYFMIWCQKSVGKMIMPDYKDPHSISYQILLWTLLGYVLMYSWLTLFFCLYYCFFFCL